VRTLIGTKGLFGVLGVLLVVGFTATSLSSFFVSRDALERALTDDALPLTGDTIFSEIQRDLLRPVFISSLMAHDTFVRDWLLSGEQDQDRIVRYLREVKERYGTITSFLVSDRTGAYYYADGKLKVVSQDDRTDAWFFRVRALTEPYETNVDADLANRNTTTIFINYRILDYDGRFLGATGVGLTTDTVSRLIADYQRRYQRRIYFVDHGGSIVLSGAGADERGGSPTPSSTAIPHRTSSPTSATRPPSTSTRVTSRSSAGTSSSSRITSTTSRPCARSCSPTSPSAPPSPCSSSP